MTTYRLSILASRIKAAFSLVELLATVAIIGIITFMAIPQVTRMRGDAERNLSIARAESLNLAVASMIQIRGRTQAQLDWVGKDDNAHYDLVKPYLSFAESTLSLYLPGGYDVDFPSTLDPLQKVVLKDATASRIFY
ncbi:MAG: hypothetical protein JWO89_3496 [Verrucomicrobiaceae bacterium]|nr:hypothetical protein [Verrucomicrobiaceae bacterium]MDB6116881.1 hypothetical protein [Verrucomicrobiaceae bacterium]